MASIAEMSDRRMSIGRVFSRAFGTIGAQPVLMFGIAFLFGALPNLLVGLALQSVRDTQAVPFSLTNIALSIGGWLIALAFTTLAHGALVRVTVAYSDGEPVTIGGAALAVARKILPLLALVALMTLAVGLASLLLVVPGIILYLVWLVAAPALIAEDTGIFAALGRSAELTKGARWNIFAIQLILSVAVYVMTMIAGIVAITSAGGFQNLAAAAASGPSALTLVVSVAFSTASITFSGAIQTALYVELRNWKDGPAASALGDIFG